MSTWPICRLPFILGTMSLKCLVWKIAFIGEYILSEVATLPTAGVVS